jgi:hypothetical protein
MDWSREELEQADLVLTVDSKGQYRWSSMHTDDEVAVMLATIAQTVWRRRHKGRVPVSAGSEVGV